MAGTADEKGEDTLNRLNKIYLTIVSRYKDYIEEQESLSVAELPTLITPKNGAIVAKVDEIKASFGAYSYDKNFHDAGTKAFSFVKEKVGEAVLPLQFWLVPEETLAFMIGDSFDRNVLLCSMLVGLGNPSAKVLVLVKSETRRVFVYYELNGFVLMDLNSSPKTFQTKEEMLTSLSIDDDTTAYEFNDRTYTDIA